MLILNQLVIPNYIIEICDVIINRMSVEEAVLVSN